MASKIKTAHAARLVRHLRIRRRVSGKASRLRLCVFRSLTHIYAQIIDDTQGHTLVVATSLDGAVRLHADARGKVGMAVRVGALLAERARKIGVSQVVFDRGGYKYHGRVKALADAAREGGLTF